jgi:tRNA threonylcarbamoyladenosine biosynthesis protein TsaE
MDLVASSPPVAGTAYAWRLVGPAQTAACGAWLAQQLVAGDRVLLDGELGAGKTTLVRALAEAAGADPLVIASPTYSLMHQYAARLPLFHVDAYRLSGPADLDALGVEESAADGVLIIEWADRVATAAVRPQAWQVRLDHAGDTARQATIMPPMAWQGRWPA